MCANGAPPPIQQPVITFRNKYTKRLLKEKKEGQLLYFSGSEWAGSRRGRTVPFRTLTSHEWPLPDVSHQMMLGLLTSDTECFSLENFTSKQQQRKLSPLLFICVCVCLRGRGGLPQAHWVLLADVVNMPISQIQCQSRELFINLLYLDWMHHPSHQPRLFRDDNLRSN